MARTGMRRRIAATPERRKRRQPRLSAAQITSFHTCYAYSMFMLRAASLLMRVCVLDLLAYSLLYTFIKK